MTAREDTTLDQRRRYLNDRWPNLNDQQPEWEGIRKWLLYGDLSGVYEPHLSEIMAWEQHRPRDGAGPYSIGSDIWPGLSKVVEESGELGTILGKIMATGGSTHYWGGRDLRVELVDEIADLRAALDFFVSVNLSDDQAAIKRLADRERVKARLFTRWHLEAQ
jgi:hypothetical protein